MSAAPVRAALVAVGDELLSGAQADTNSAWLAGRLAAVGIAVQTVELVGDDEALIAEAVERGLACAELVFVGGGLGPTLDDVSRNGIARLLGRELVEDEPALAELRAWFERRAVPMSETNRRQVQFPVGARILRNRAGSAPGFLVELDREHVVFSLPGPPRELRVVWQDEVLPWLASRGWARQPIAERRYYLFGIPESLFAERSGSWMERDADPLIGCTVRDGTLTATLRARSDTAASLARLDERAQEFRLRFAKETYSESDWEIEAALARELFARGATITAAESCTGGLVQGLLTGIPGISRVFSQGFVTYSDEAKTRALGVSRELLERFGAVSREVAEAMALGAVRVTGAELALAVTGIAGPDGGSTEKPVGLVWFATAWQGEVASVERRLPPVDRDSIRRVAARTALHLGWRRLVAARTAAD